MDGFGCGFLDHGLKEYTGNGTDEAADTKFQRHFYIQISGFVIIKRTDNTGYQKRKKTECQRISYVKAKSACVQHRQQKTGNSTDSDASANCHICGCDDHESQDR